MVEKTHLPQRLLITISLTLIGISPFLQWINITAPTLYGVNVTRSGFELLPEAGYFATIFLAIGILTAWFYRKTIHTGLIVLIMGAWMLIETATVYPELQKRVALTGEELIVSIGTGYYLLAISAILTIISGVALIAAAKKEAPPAPTNTLSPVPEPPLEPKTN